MKRLSAVVVALLLPTPVSAQKDQPEPKRPTLYASADTNDAFAYYSYGMDVLDKDPKKAADAFYWSARLNPLSADAFYSRRVALLLTEPDRLVRYWRGDNRTMRSKEIQQIDSLYFQALMLNPFFYEKLEKRLQDAVIRQIIRRNSSASGASPAEIEYEIQNYLSRAGPGERAFRAYSFGDFHDALQQYALAIKSSRYKFYYRSMRGRLFFQLGQVDSALTELSLAVEEMRKLDTKELVYVYQSKALLEHSIAMAHERRGDIDKAREAYGRALQEDLGYSPAHIRLALVALDQKDTTTALSEFDLASQIRPNDPGVRFMYGFALLEARRFADAEAQLQKAMELNAFFALPRFGLARAYEEQGKTAEALREYRAYLSLVSRQDPRRSAVEQRIAALAAKG